MIVVNSVTTGRLAQP